ncbi:MAG: T9SS type A sorting domain-containing protein [Ignavibacteria bacterium]|nr:T9SS type A sorting domain-containing protein [Ignavibacteria bacterium]
MKTIILTFLILISISISSNVSAQLEFVRIGGEITYGSTGANYAYAYFKNTGTTPVEVRFKRTVNNLPDPAWSSSICVELCYAPFIDLVPLEGDPALTLQPGEQDTMDITYESPTLGTSHVVIRMYREDDPNQYVERNFDLVVNSVGISNISSLAESYSLSQNYPNPFNPTTNINFSIPTQGNVSLKVYDILGNEVADLLNNEKLAVGQYNINFNGSDLSSGIYYYTIRTDNFMDTKRMMLVK